MLALLPSLDQAVRVAEQRLLGLHRLPDVLVNLVERGKGVVRAVRVWRGPLEAIGAPEGSHEHVAGLLARCVQVHSGKRASHHVPSKKWPCRSTHRLHLPVRMFWVLWADVGACLEVMICLIRLIDLE